MMRFTVPRRTGTAARRRRRGRDPMRRLAWAFPAVVMLALTGCTSSSQPSAAQSASSTAQPGKATLNCDDPKYRDPNSKDPLAEQCARIKSVTSKGAQVHYTKKFDLSGLPTYKPEQKVSGTIRQSGNNYLGDSPVAKRWEKAFQKYQPGVKFQDNLVSSAVGIPSLYTGTADVAPMGREILWDELQGYQRQFNSQPLEVTVTTGSYDVTGWTNALAVFVNKANPLSKLSFSQIDGIFGAARTGVWDGQKWDPTKARGADKNIRTWGQLGLTGDWADKPIHVYGYTPEYHFGNFVAKEAMQGSSSWNENIKQFANFTRPDGSLAIAGDVFMDELTKDPYGIAYSGIDFLKPSTKALPLSRKGDGPFVSMSLDTVQDRSYPLTRSTYYYLIKGQDGKLDPKVKEFIRFILSREGQQIIMEDGKYLPLTPKVAQKQLAKLN
ncbi:PstS family phosphate ABC transporter substrate-binding protein [Streptomyces scopuliridis]|uniref:PstS family phosphate ABC transporter substrate-binding protein n=1 Tax=Streptomyces scopuliridis TaxID=452529 RepID=UPI0036CAD897